MPDLLRRLSPSPFAACPTKRPRGVGSIRSLPYEAAARSRVHSRFPFPLAVAAALLGAGCELRREMYDQAKIEPLEYSAFFEDGRGSRLPVEGTVPVGHLRADDHRYLGLGPDGETARGFPEDIEVTFEFVKRGQERYQIFCSVCHGYAGHGDGMVVQRGFTRPPSYHEERLREEPEGYLFQVISNGFGVMNGYASSIPVEDRWAIVAYVRALQISQNATLGDVPPEGWAELDLRGVPSGTRLPEGGRR